MALVSAKAFMAWPGYVSEYIQGSIGFATDQTLDAAGEYAAWVGFAEQDMTVSHVGFRCGTATGSPTVEVRIETVTASTGFPSGTLFGTNTNGTTGTLSSNTYTLQALTASASITRGQAFAVLAKYASGTSIVISRSNNFAPSVYSIPYEVTNTSGSAVKALLSGPKTFALGSSTTSFYPQRGMIPASALNPTNTYNNTNSAKRGLRFQLPFPARIIGIRWFTGNNAGDYNVVVTDDAGSELSSSSTAFEGDIFSGSTQAARYVFLDSAVSLSKDTWYRAAIEPSSATNTNLSTLQLPSANYRSAMPGGVNQHYTTFASGSWTDSATDTLPVMDLLLDQFDDGTGGGASAAYVIG